MNVFMTQGTPEYLLSIKSKYPNEKMEIFQNEDTGLLVHETSGTSVFKEPRKYEIVDSVGEITGEGFVVCNNIPVTEEGRPVFEYRFKNRTGLIEKEPGFVAISVLRPINSDTYVIFTLWKNENYFQQWKQSKSFNQAHKKKETTADGIELQKTIFPRPSYVTTFMSLSES